MTSSWYFAPQIALKSALNAVTDTLSSSLKSTPASTVKTVRIPAIVCSITEAAEDLRCACRATAFVYLR